MRNATLLLLALGACVEPEPPPLGMILAEDDIIYAGVAQIDVTPTIAETWTDGDGDNDFSGCLNDPSGVSCNSADTWDDANGNGKFDAVWIAGFGPMRPATGVHDPITVTATVISFNGEYIALVAMDFVGIHSPRIHQARDALAADGFASDRMIAASSHNHQGPDVFGIWGNPFNFSDPVSGIIPAYNDLAAASIEKAVRDAAGSMEEVSLRVGKVHMRDQSSYFNGANFGGHNPKARMHGMINDGRDPVVVSDQVLVMQGVGNDGTVFTITNWSGHPETWGSGNTLISSDWVGKTRSVLADHYGGVVMHLPESLGGMQSALGGGMPLVNEATGELIMDEGTYDDGTPIPKWAEKDTWEYVQSHGWHIAHAAIKALDEGQTVTEAPIKVKAQETWIPVTNSLYNLLLPLGLTEIDAQTASFDPVDCPDSGLTEYGCLPTRSFRATIGPVGFISVPGELLPELAWGLPTDPKFAAESNDRTTRGDGAIYFPQHDADCNTEVELYTECVGQSSVGDCDCLAVHNWPYTLSADPAVPPLLDMLDTEYKAIIGMTDHYVSYIVPDTDYNPAASYISGDGDHYEDSVSMSQKLGSRIQEAQQKISEDWND